MLGLPLFAGVTSAQYPNATAGQIGAAAALLQQRQQLLLIITRMADKVVQKYQNSTCEELRQKRRQPKSKMEKDVIQLLHADQQMRAAFINRAARPVANKMLECGLIPTPDLGRPTISHTTVQTVGPIHPPP